MKLNNVFNLKRPTLSFEVFPPKQDTNYESVKSSTLEIAALKPSYMSVTYGAGGSTDKYTLDIAKNILNTHNITPIAHLTCVNSTKEKIKEQLRQFKENNIENILALRGDRPAGEEILSSDYTYACELIKDIKEFGDFCVGGACYPEGHTESQNSDEDIFYLKQKVDCGCDFLTTQMFFDNNILYKFLYKIREKGINVPVVAGIMPVTSGSQIERICALSGTYLPQRFVNIVDRFGKDTEAMTQAGIAYATEQIIDLIANGVNNIHVYSMNKPFVAQKIKENLSHIIKYD